MQHIKQITAIKQLDGKIIGDSIVMNGTSTDLALPLGYGLITQWEGSKTYSGFSDNNVKELNLVNRLGALLWRHNTTGVLIADNADTTAENYWNPQETPADPFVAPTKEGYTLIGVNVGIGKWAYYEETKTTNNLVWASEGSTRFNTFITGAVHTDGWNATNAVLAVTDDATDTIFSRLVALRNSENENIPVFLPSKLELLEMQNNCCSVTHTTEGSCSYENNIGKLLSLSADAYWSSSQAVSGNNDVLKVRFNSSLISNDSKSNTVCKGVLFLHF